MKQSKPKIGITFRSFLIGFLFAALFAGITVHFSAGRTVQFPTATQIPVLPYVLLLICVLLLNPLGRLIRLGRGLSPAELLLIFTMGVVSSGVSTFGLAAQLVPVIGNLFNPAWNHDQSEWNRHVVPVLNDRYFLSVEGIHQAAQNYTELHAEHQQIRRIVDAAGRCILMEQRLEAARENAAQARTDTSANPAALERAMVLAEAGLREAERYWNELRSRQSDLGSPREALERYREPLERLENQTAEARAALAELEAVAFDRVQEFRRGLPDNMQAYPGFIKMASDTRRSYLARVNRTLRGTQARKQLGEALDMLDDAESGASEPLAPRLEPKLQQVLENLTAMSDAETLVLSDVEDLRTLEAAHTARLSQLRGELRDLNAQRRVADREEMRSLDREIYRRQRQATAEQRHLNRTVERRRSLEQQIETIRNVHPLRRTVEALLSPIADGTLPADLRLRLIEVESALPSVDGSWRRFLAGDVPWRLWGAPLLRWGIVIGLTYLVLMTFNVLIFRQWAHNEKLIYPLAELPELLVGDGQAGDGAVPAVYRNGLFWTGFLISGLILGYNAVAATDWIPGLSATNLNNTWNPYIRGTALDGLSYGWTTPAYARSAIFFTMIGLAFLIPTKVSFSLWFFTVLGMVQLLFLVWSGHGQNELSFRPEWWYTLNFRTAQGGGALIVFASVVLYKCRRYLLCAFRPLSLEGLEPDERLELRLSSFLFVMGSIGLILMLWLSMGANLLYTVVSYFIIMVITIGLVRAVAEGGILGFQAWVSPFHFIRTFFGMGRSWTHGGLFAPLMVYYSVLFLDIKTFIAPAMANGLKIREDLRMQRGRFHAAMFAAILVAAVVSLVISIMMAYHLGADVMQSWFYTAFPRGLFSKIAEINEVPPGAVRAEALWTGVGALAMVALLYFRQTLFWLPHPIGMIMLVNPIMGAYWFSILLGWLAKSLVTKYGSKDAYVKARALFIGLIVGELVMVAVAMFLSYRLEIRIPIDLNRN